MSWKDTDGWTAMDDDVVASERGNNGTLYLLRSNGDLTQYTAENGEYLSEYLVNPNVQSFTMADAKTLYILYKNGELERRIPGVIAYVINPNVQSFTMADANTLYILYKNGELERRIPGVSAYVINPNVQSFTMADAKTLYILYKNGELERRIPGVSAYLINPDVQSFTMADANTLYILHKNGVLERRIAGVSVYLINPNVQSFTMANKDTLYILYTNGELECRVPGVSSTSIRYNIESFTVLVPQTLNVVYRDGTTEVWKASAIDRVTDESVRSLVMDDASTLYVLYANGELVRRTLGGGSYLINSNVGSFAVADPNTVYILYKNGELERRNPGVSAYLINPDVQSFTMADAKTLYILYKNGELERRIPGVSAYVINPNVQSFTMADANTLYILYKNGELERRIPGVSAYLINPNVQSFTMADANTLYILYKNGELERRIPGVSAYLINPNVQSFAMANKDTLYILYTDGELECRVPGVSSTSIRHNVESFTVPVPQTLNVVYRDGTTEVWKASAIDRVTDESVRSLVMGDASTPYVLYENGNLVRWTLDGGSYLINPNVGSFAVADPNTVYILYKNGELERRIPGVSAYVINPNVQSFTMADANTLYILYKNGELERRIPGVSAYVINPNVQSFTMADANTLYILYKNGELERRIPGVSAYLINPNVQSFTMADANTLYILYKNGELERRIPGVNAYLINPNVQSFTMADANTLYILYKNGELERRIPGVSAYLINPNVQSFAMADAYTLYILNTSGELERRVPGVSSRAIDSGVQSFSMLDGNTLDVVYRDGRTNTRLTGLGPTAPRTGTPSGFSAVLRDGLLFVAGSQLADLIIVSQLDDRLSVAGVDGSFDARQVQRIVIDAQAGNDIVLLDRSGTLWQQPISVGAKVHGGIGNDTVRGGFGADVLMGGDGDDTVRGGFGKDVLMGGDGDDVLDGSDGYDTVDYRHASNVVRVNRSTGIAIGEGTDRLISIENTFTFESQLALRWAPILYHEIDKDGGILGAYDDSLGGKSDCLTAANFDGNWDTNDNWENLETYPANAYVYYSVVATSTHWYILYGFYHPRDWTDFDPPRLDTHENDMEGVLAIVKRSNASSASDDFGQLQALVTNYHTDFYSSVAPGSPLYNTRIDNSKEYEGTFGWEAYSGGDHPIVEEEGNGHAVGVNRWFPPTNFPEEDGVRYVPTLDTAEEPSYPNDRDVAYQLVDVFEPGGLWAHRYDPQTFAQWGSFRGDDGQDNAAQAPWVWDDEGWWVNGTSDDGLPRGTIALDPARLADVYFGGESFARSYVSNPYTGSTSSRDVVAFSVRGFGGVHSPPAVERYLSNRGADTRVVNWNDIGGLGFPGDITADPSDFVVAVAAMAFPPILFLDIPFIDLPDPGSDDGFVSDMVTLLNTYDDSDTIILIGHSFGGDSILKVAQGTSRDIDFLAALDPVGPAGLRATLPEPVPSNVKYFYNRWQTVTPFPIDFTSSGILSSNARGSVAADLGISVQSGISPAPATGLAHNDVPYDPTVQNELIRIIDRLMNTAPVTVSDSYSVDEDNVLMVPLRGVLANDSDAENGPLTAIKVRDPEHGQLILAAEGSFIYRPDKNFNREDSFSYRANDGVDDSQPTTVQIVIDTRYPWHNGLEPPERKC